MHNLHLISGQHILLLYPLLSVFWMCIFGQGLGSAGNNALRVFFEDLPRRDWPHCLFP